MTISQIENNIQNLLSDCIQEQFIFDFLLAYGESKATIARLKKGKLNQLDEKGVHHRKKPFESDEERWSICLGCMRG